MVYISLPVAYFYLVCTFVAGYTFGNVLIYYFTAPLANATIDAGASSNSNSINAVLISHNLDKNREDSAWPTVERESWSEAGSKNGRHLYFITPTVRGPTQVADLVRTAQAIYPLRSLVTWLIFEDSQHTKNSFPNHLNVLEDHLKDFRKIMNIRINWTSRSEIAMALAKTKWRTKGVEARNDGINYVKQSQKPGVLYFGDDDNTYDPELLRQILGTKGVSAFPVGCVTPVTRVSSPIVKNGKIIDIYDGWKGSRKFPMDFAGFAIAGKLLKEHPDAKVPSVLSYGETGLLSYFNLELEDFEPLANNCTKVWTYHTQTAFTSPRGFKFSNATFSLEGTNLSKLLKRYSFLYPSTQWKINNNNNTKRALDIVGKEFKKIEMAKKRRTSNSGNYF